MTTFLFILGSALMALPLAAAIHDLIVDAPAARTTFTLIILFSLAVALGVHLHD